MGPGIYELHSVIVHSGSAIGGHYYAYIKDLSNGLWHKFNDSSVNVATVQEVMETFGDDFTYGSAATAYMLVYRKVTSAKLGIEKPLEGVQSFKAMGVSDYESMRTFPKRSEVPEHVRHVIREEQELKRRKQQEEELSRKMRTLSIHRGGDTREIKLHQDSTIQQLTEKHGTFVLERQVILTPSGASKKLGRF